MQVRVLGEVELAGDSSGAVGGPNQRRLLAALAIRRGEVVSLPWLVDVLWPGGDAPPRAEHNVRTYVHRLRTALGDEGDRVETVGAGYRLRLDAAELDLARYETLADTAIRAAQTGDPTAAIEQAQAAEQLWRGHPLGAFEHEAWAQPTTTRLLERRANVREHLAAALLELERPSEAVEVLEALVHDEPLRERPRALLMQALNAAGRQAEALRAFQHYRSYLVEEIGVEPSADLTALDHAIALGSVPPPATQPHRRIGVYELHERVGLGAVATVHRATQPSLGREVALKIVRAEFANQPEFIRRFEAEAQLVSRVEHTNIVPLYDYWREPDRAVLTMRWMSGGSLEQRLDRPWSLAETTTLVDQIASALDAAHRHGVVHRDVKPGNILFDSDGRAYLADFGIALDAGRRPHPDAPVSPRSPVYAAPEQLRDEPAGAEADVYALAMVAYALLAGGAPFADSPTEAALLHRQLHEALPSIRAVRPDLPEAIDEVFAGATAKCAADRCASPEAFALALRSVATGTVARAAGRPAGERVNPFKGLAAFTETDADDFHGRDRLVGELLERMDDPDFRLLAVVGPSGSGKSSVVRAGLIPALRQGRVRGSAEWFVTSMMPGDQPFEALETALLRVAVNPPPSLLEQLRDGDRGVLRSTRRILPDDDGVVLVVIDQFEELFTPAVSDADRDGLLRALAAALTERSTPLRVVLTLRADFFDRPLRHPAFAPLLKQSTAAITPLSPDELERAIVDPAAAAGVGFEPGLVADIVADVNRNPGALPLMQFALTRAFDHASGDTITLDDYRAVGGLNGALAQRAEELWQAAAAAEQAATRRMFGRLVTLGEGREDTRRRVLRSELGDDAATAAMVDRYGAARLLSFDRDTATREPTLEVAHEAVLRSWPRLREWLDEDRDAIRVHRHLSAASTDWVASGRDRNELYRGSRLTAAESLRGNPAVELNAQESEFVAAGMDLRRELEAATRKRARRRWYVTAAMAVVAVLAITASVVALNQRDRADAQAAEARDNEALAAENAAIADERAAESERARQDAEAERTRADEAAAAADLQRLEAQAAATVEQDPGLAALLAVEAHRISGGDVTSASTLHRVLSGTRGIETTIPGLYGGSVVSRDGTTLVAFEIGAVEVWDLRTLTLVHRVETPVVVGFGYDVTPDASRVVFSKPGGTFLLDVATTTVTEVLPEKLDVIALSPDGRLLAVGLPGALQIWDVATPSSPTLVDEQPGAGGALDVAWSPDGQALAVVKGSMAVEYWRLGETVPAWAFQPRLGSNGRLGSPSMLFGTDGRTLVVAIGEARGSGVIVRTYDTADGTMVRPEISMLQVPAGMTWLDEPAGQLISGTWPSARVIALDLNAGRQVPPPFDAENVIGVGYSVALDRFVTTNQGGIEIRTRVGSGPLERVIELPPAQQDALAAGGSIYASVAPPGKLVTAVFQLDLQPETVVYDLSTDPATWERFAYQGLPTGAGRYLLMTYWDNMVVLDPDLQPMGAGVVTPTDTQMFRPSPDGRFFVVSLRNGRLHLYRSTGELVAELEIPPTSPGALVFASFTADGDRLLGYNGAGDEGRWTIWDTDSGDVLDAGTAHELINPRFGGDTLYAERELGDFSVVQLDPVSHEPVGPPLTGSVVTYGSYVESGDGTLVARSTFDGTTRVYDKATGTIIGRELTGTADNPDSEFAADGTTLMVITGKHVSLWNYDIDSWPGIACRVAGRNLTRAEWEEFGPRTVEYRATCPQFPIED